MSATTSAWCDVVIESGTAQDVLKEATQALNNPDLYETWQIEFLCNLLQTSFICNSSSNESTEISALNISLVGIIKDRNEEYRKKVADAWAKNPGDFEKYMLNAMSMTVYEIRQKFSQLNMQYDKRRILSDDGALAFQWVNKQTQSGTVCLIKVLRCRVP